MELAIHKMSHFHSGKKILSDITFDLSEGLYILIGSNGSGKTTLIRSLAGVIKPTEGNITFNYSDIFSSNIQYRELLGYAPQHFGYYPLYTVRKFLLYIATLKGINKREAQGRIEELVITLHLSDYQNVKMKDLSEGIRKRVNIAQSLLNNPKILLLDEPTAGLDISESMHMRNLLSKLADNKVVLYSSHIMRDVESGPKEVLLMNGGRLITKKKPSSLLKQLEGKVWVSDRSVNPVEIFKASTLNSSSHSNVYSRFYSETKVPAARSVDPRWEDLHLLFNLTPLD